jgi:hypothetical protein
MKGSGISFYLINSNIQDVSLRFIKPFLKLSTKSFFFCCSFNPFRSQMDPFYFFLTSSIERDIRKEIIETKLINLLLIGSKPLALHFSGSKYVSPYIVVVKQALYSSIAFRDSLLMSLISGSVRINNQYIIKVVGNSQEISHTFVFPWNLRHLRKFVTKDLSSNYNYYIVFITQKFACHKNFSQ